MILEWFLRFVPSASTSNQNNSGDIPAEGGPEKGASAPGGLIAIRIVNCSINYTHLTYPEARTNDQSGGFLANATGFTIGEANMFDHPQFAQAIHNTIVTGTAGMFFPRVTSLCI